jgi:hypothetical protein
MMLIDSGLNLAHPLSPEFFEVRDHRPAALPEGLDQIGLTGRNTSRPAVSL